MKGADPGDSLVRWAPVESEATVQEEFYFTENRVNVTSPETRGLPWWLAAVHVSSAEFTYPSVSTVVKQANKKTK